MPIELRIVDGRGAERHQPESFPDFTEAMRAGIRLADDLGRAPDYEPAKAKAVQLFAGSKRVLTIAVVKGGLPDR